MELLPALRAEPERAATGRSAAIVNRGLRLGYHTLPSTENITLTKPSIVLSDLPGKGADAGVRSTQIAPNHESVTGIKSDLAGDIEIRP